MTRLMTVKQVAKLYGVHPVTIHRWLLLGKLRSRRIPGTRKHVFLESDLLAEPKEAS